MKIAISVAVALVISLSTFAQVKIHSHNDYLQGKPFYTALENRVYEMEADIFVRNDSIFVAHSEREIHPSRTLSNMYLNPIAREFELHKNRVSSDKKYNFSLMIDVKEKWEDVYPVLKAEIEKYGGIFDRNKSKLAVQIVISGSRPAPNTFQDYPKWLFFDGLPNVAYTKKELERIAIISDRFASHSKWRGQGTIPQADIPKIQKVIDIAISYNKPVRFWGAPDTKTCWKQLATLGADVINTDKIKETKDFFENEL
ncbi:MAG: glycerophosphodiester phosphodiesterase [Pedobacter sp.]|nr:MAG: glycerophosphodiester phosphodiesterase [Pedobacter sp.]